MGFHEEKKKIFDEMMRKSKLIDQEEDEAWKSGKIRGLDDSFSLKQKEVAREYNQKLRKLKEKYGIE